jgi:hypothetical protein
MKKSLFTIISGLAILSANPSLAASSPATTPNAVTQAAELTTGVDSSGKAVTTNVSGVVAPAPTTTAPAGNLSIFGVQTAIPTPTLTNQQAADAGASALKGVGQQQILSGTQLLQKSATGLLNGIPGSNLLAPTIDKYATQLQTGATNLLNDGIKQLAPAIMNQLSGMGIDLGSIISSIFGGGGDPTANAKQTQASKVSQTMTAGANNVAAAISAAENTSPNGEKNINGAATEALQRSQSDFAKMPMSDVAVNVSGARNLYDAYGNLNPGASTAMDRSGFIAQGNLAITSTVTGAQGQLNAVAQNIDAAASAGTAATLAQNVPDNSLDQLHLISQQLGEHGKIAATNTQILTETRTLVATSASQQAQSAQDRANELQAKQDTHDALRADSNSKHRILKSIGLGTTTSATPVTAATTPP